MKKSEAFPSRFLSAADLNGKPRVLTIECVKQELLGNGSEEKQLKHVLYFKGERKSLPLNITNWNAVVDVTGEDDSDDWPTHRVEVFPTQTEMRGKVVGCVRVRAPSDTLPLEQPRQKPKAKPKPKPKALPPIEEDDSIPFN